MPNPAQAGTLVKTIPWKHNGNPCELWYYGSRERTDMPKGYASGRQAVELVESA